MSNIFHALVLNLHQPPRNLEDLLDHQTWEAKEILYALDRIPRTLWDYEKHGRVHLSMSGTLLETLVSPEFQQRVYGTVDCGSLLWHLQNRNVIDILGTGYYHPVLPLIPEADIDEHLRRWQSLGNHIFWRDSFQGFWPPEMGFAMHLIPHLKRFNYRYVLVDSEHVEPVTAMRWEELRYRPHIARFGGEEIIVVVRDRELSDAQESGMTFDWFQAELRERTKWCDFPPLVTTCTDGENGGWFRNTTPSANYWGAFYKPYMDAVTRAETPLRPTFIHDYLDRYGAHGEVVVRTGAWNTGWHHGRDFLQWTGSQAQRDALARIAAVSRRLHEVRNRLTTSHPDQPRLNYLMEQAHWRLLRAETSCNVFWGEAWVPRCHNDLDDANTVLDELEVALPPLADPKSVTTRVS